MTDLTNARSKPIDLGGGRWMMVNCMSRDELSALRRGDRTAYVAAKARADAAAFEIAKRIAAAPR